MSKTGVLYSHKTRKKARWMHNDSLTHNTLRRSPACFERPVKSGFISIIQIKSLESDVEKSQNQQRSNDQMDALKQRVNTVKVFLYDVVLLLPPNCGQCDPVN
jgi:hypothetical protein